MKENVRKVVIITGANSGIGFTTARYLTEKGYKIYSISRSASDSMGFANYQCDVNDFVKIGDIFEDIYRKEKRIDALINNAGFGIGGALENASPENIYKLMDTNLSAVLTLSSMAIKYLKKTKGKIINISSVAGVVPLPFQACYSASKAGVEVGSRALASEVKKFGVKVTAIFPWDTKSNFTSSRVIEKADKDKELRKMEEKSLNKVEKHEKLGMEPIRVSKVIHRVLKSNHPPLRKSVGFMAKFVTFAQRLVPTRLLNWLVRRLYC